MGREGTHVHILKNGVFTADWLFQVTFILTEQLRG